MTPLLVAAAGLVALVAGGLVLRTFGPQYRIGRLLASTPRVSISEANEIAAAGHRSYVRIDGRIDADDEFEDADHRPLVFRRVRIEAQVGRRWRPFEDHRQAVPFQVNEGLDSIGVDVDALGEGLIVVPRESLGRAADLPDRTDQPPDTTVRARIEQVSSVEHATVVGFPVAESAATGDAAGITAHMTAGRGRPLILSVLEPDEAMRILAGGDASRTRLAAGLLGLGAVLLAAAVLWAVVAAILPAVIALIPSAGWLVETALAASAAPTSAAGGDPRSSGEGPGLVGAPGLALLGVAVIAVLAILLTSVYVRLTRPVDTGDRASATRRR